MDVPLSMDQLEVFVVVARSEGFAEAARSLGRTQSAVSKAVAALERTLGLELFVRTSRGVELAPSGRALLSRAKETVQTGASFAAEARRLADTTVTETHIAIDAFAPTEPVVTALSRWNDAHACPLIVAQEHLATPVRMLASGAVELALCGPTAREHHELDATFAGTTWMVPVCAAKHPLAAEMAERGHVRRVSLAEHLHLYLTDRSRGSGVAAAEGVRESRWWKLSDLQAKHACLGAGLGWGMMPLHHVSADVAAGRLAVFRIEGLRPRWAHEHYLAVHRERPQTPAVVALHRELLRALGEALDGPVDPSPPAP